MNLDFISYPLGSFMNFIYNNLAFLSYGLSIIIFTLFIRIILLPLTIKQYQSMAKTQEVQPLIQEIQKRYKNDKEKLNQELMKVYQENNVNPAGGCLPLLIQMPILFSLYYVISSPLKYMFGKTDATINSLLDFVKAHNGAVISNLRDISIINFFSDPKNQQYLKEVSENLKPNELLNLNFLGLNLGLVPKWNPQEIMSSPLASQYWVLLLIPILAAVTTYISIKFSTSQTQSSGGNEMAASMNNSMSTMMPLMTAFFAFSVPAGLGLYWIVNNIIQVFQQMFINKYIIKKKEVVNK
ncbi:MAG: YidC/Oxa1 family membrane protein insertase [Clostridia bacterium]|nr:YidC/Oxa1 family membrane protein insertase [Clostridia bacterium]